MTTLDACQSRHDRADDSGPALTCEWCERKHHSVATQPYARWGLVFHVRACEDCYSDWLTANRAELEEARNA